MELSVIIEALEHYQTSHEERPLTPAPSHRPAILVRHNMLMASCHANAPLVSIYN
jgi:hypothetical protein